VQALAEGTRVEIDVCVARTNDFRIDPGSYAGTVTITDVRVTELVVPMNVTLAYRKPFKVGLLFLPLLVAGTWYVWTIKEIVDPTLTFSAWRRTRAIGAGFHRSAGSSRW